MIRSLQDIAAADCRERLLWAVRVRWLVIAGFSVLAVIARAMEVLPSLGPCALAAGVGGLVNAWNHWCVVRSRWVRTVTALAIPGDILLITYVLIHTGGVNSPFAMMYVVQVVTTAMLVGLRVAAGSAAASVAGLLGAIFLQARGLITAGGLDQVPSGAAGYPWVWAAFLLYCLSLLVFLGGYIAERLRRSERDLAAKNERLRDALTALESAHADLAATYERLRAAEAQLVHSEKMRALGQFVAGIAHELNNPVSFIAANIEHLQRRLLPVPELLAAYAIAPIEPAHAERLAAQRRASRIDDFLADLPSLWRDCEEGVRRTKDILDGLRTFARTDRSEAWQMADIHAGLERTLALVRHRFGAHVAVERHYGELPLVESLPGQLDQVFMNLLANAADAVGDAGRIAIETRFIADARQTPRAGPHVAVTIRDSGDGIPDEVMRHIFDPFFTTKPVGRGTGLGLSVSYGVVGRHGGTILVDSSAGYGTAFTVYLPVRQAGGAPGA